MTTYRIEMSDRVRARTVTADDVKSALAVAYGERFFNARHDHDVTDRSNRVLSSHYEVTVQTGPTVRGSTPVKSTWAVVSQT